MTNRMISVPLVFLTALAGAGSPVHGNAGCVTLEETVRQLYVPFDDLAKLLEDQPQRVLLSRSEYEDLLRQARKDPKVEAPRSVMVVSADYAIAIGEQRAELVGTIVLEVLEKGLHTVELDLSGVGIRAATLDGRSAAIAHVQGKSYTLFVEDVGRHELVLDLVTEVVTTAVHQTFSFRVPTPPATRMSLTAPGNVEIRQGASVMMRRFDEAAQVTRFELLPEAVQDTVIIDEVSQATHVVPGPEPGTVSLVMTLNNRLLQSRRVVVARGVIIDEITKAYERLHATFSMAVLQRPVETFRFVLPEGLELTHVNSPLLSHWAVQGSGPERTLEVQLREPTTETVLITLSGVFAKSESRWADWSLPRFQPLDVAGEAAVVGLLLDNRLKIVTLTSEKLIPIDTNILNDALPPTLLSEEGNKPRLRAVAAFYAPIGVGVASVHGQFEQPAKALSVVTSALLTLEEKNVTLLSGFALRPKVEKLFSVDLSVPTMWHISGVTDASGIALPFEFYKSNLTEDPRIHVQLSAGVAPGQQYNIHVHATNTPVDWLTEWTSAEVIFPVVSVISASDDVGAIAVQPGQDMTVYPDTLEGLTPIDRDEKATYGLSGIAESHDSPAYRFDARPYRAVFRIERIAPRITSRTYSFFRLDRDLLTAHYEIAYDVEDARTERLAFMLPVTTPADVSIRARDSVSIKEYEGTVVDDVRRWTVLLAERHSDTIWLTVDFEHSLDGSGEAELDLPIVKADGVAFQSGYVVIEGGPGVELEIIEHPRKVDVGELAGAAYRPDRSDLALPSGGSVFAFVGADPKAKVRMSRPPKHALPSAIVERAELVTQVSDDGLSRTAARFHLRTKAAFLQIQLPEGSTLWSTELDGIPAKPQREGGHLLLSLPAKGDSILRDLRLVYETPIEAVAFWGELNVPAPKLQLRTNGEEGAEVEIPVADLDWHLHVPAGVTITKHGGTVAGDPLRLPEPAAWRMAKFLYRLTGGVNIFYYLPKLSRARQSLYNMPSDATGSAPFPVSRVARNGREPRQRDGKDESTRRSTRSKRGAARPFAGPGADALVGKSATGFDQDKEAGRVSEGRAGVWELGGVRSLKIDLERSGSAIAFRSLGHDPRLSVTLANTRRVASLAWGLALGIGVGGVSLMNRSGRAKARYVLGIILAATALPFVLGAPGLMYITNPVVYVICALVPFYLGVRFVKWLAKILRWRTPLPTPATAALALVLILGTTAHADPTPGPGHQDNPVFVRVVDPAGPVVVPDDAILVPYDPNVGGLPTPGAAPGDQLLVPYDRYVQLWNLAYPDDPVEGRAASGGYALAGAAFSATLDGTGSLTVDGHLEIDVHSEGHVAVPLNLEGGVLARAVLDGEPAHLGLAKAPADQDRVTARPQGEPSTAMPLTLQVSGKGRHRLDLTIRMKLTRQGGWSMVTGRLPAAPATSMTLRIPRAGTEVRLGGLHDRQSYETVSQDETIETALAADGRLRIEWRPTVSEGHIDPTLTARSDALFDIREDGLHLIWEVKVDFARTERDAFALMVPSEYLVETVEGPNVRGWVTRPIEATDAGTEGQQVKITLLKAAYKSGSVVVVLHRTVLIEQGGHSTFGVPVVRVSGAVLHKGRLTIRRSPLLSLRTEHAGGVTRTDVPDDADRLADLSGDERASPLGVQAYQAYRFASVPFDVDVHVTAKPIKPYATLQTVLRIAERQRDLESRIKINAGAYPIYRVRIVVPNDLKIEHVSAPAASDWSVTVEGARRVLNVYLATGRHHWFDLLVRGRLGEREVLESVALPRLEVLDAAGQRGAIVVQVDPAFGLQVADLINCREVPLEQTYNWLVAEQRSLSRLALQYRSAAYSGLLRLSPREPIVTCSTITNVRVTEAAVEDTILLDFTVERAGIRSIAFLLPHWMKDSRITLPMLRQKTVEPISDAADAPVRVRLQLEDDVMGRLRVLIEKDRLLTSEVQRAPVPTVETGRVIRRFVTLENAGRDEVVIDELVGLETLSHQQKEWRMLAGMLGGTLTQAYLANGPDPLLSFKTKERVVVETAGARIGLAETVLVLDAHGTYRAEQTYRIDNRTEQFLEIELPASGKLWSAVVAGQLVKPAEVPGSPKPGRIRIPLTRTAAGDLDYLVALKYGGRMPPPGGLRSVEFPLIRTVNVQVELSQVQLLLPETHHWLDFGGTMRQVVDEGDLAAGHVRYQTRVAQRLVETMRSDSPFAQVRAAAKVAELKAEIEEYREAVSSYEQNLNLQKAFAGNLLTLGEGFAVSQQVASRSQQPGADEDNRYLLNSLFEGQRISRARNVLQNLPANFDDRTARQREEQARRQGFKRQWLDANQLSNAAPDAFLQRLEQGEFEPSLVVGPDASEAPQAPQVVPQQEQAKGYSPTQQRQRQQQRSPRRIRRKGKAESLAQYQVQLQQQQAQQFAFDNSDTQSTPQERDYGFGLPSIVGGVLAGEATGLASLAVELPVRGVPYYFTTPRGEVSIKARAVSSQFIETLQRVCLLLVVVGIGAVGYAATRRWLLAWRESPTWSTLLIGLGLIGVAIGVLPVLGVAMLALGIISRLNLRHRARAA